MKRSFKLASTLAISTLWFFDSAEAQQPPAPPKLAGFVFVNAVGLNAKAQLMESGKSLLKGGVDSGGSTSGIPLPVGPHQIQVTVPGLDQVQTNLTTAVGACPILVAYMEEVTDPTTKMVKRTLKLATLPSNPQKNRYLTTVISVVPRVIQMKINGQPANLEYMKPHQVEGRILRILDATNNEVIDTEYNEKTSQFCLLLEAQDKKLKSILVPDMIYVW